MCFSSHILQLEFKNWIRGWLDLIKVKGFPKKFWLRERSSRSWEYDNIYNIGSGDLSHIRRKLRSWERNKRQWKSHRVSSSESFCGVIWFNVPVTYTKIKTGGSQRAVCLSSKWWCSATIVTMQMDNWPGLENKNTKGSKRSGGERIARSILKSQWHQ